MSILKMIKMPAWQWRQIFATLVVNLMSVHLGVFLSDSMLNNKFFSAIWIVVTHFNMTKVNETMMNQTIKSMCDSCEEYRLEYKREYDQYYRTDEYLNFIEFAFRSKPKYINAEDMYFAEWMQKITVFCIGAVIPLALYIGDRFGRKKALSVSAILFIIAFLPFDAINISRQMPSIAAVMIFGVACAFQVYNVCLYVHEISSSNSRRLHHFIQILFIFTGFYFRAVKPDLLNTSMTKIFNLLPPVLFLIGLEILPESPVWLAKKDKISETKRARNWFQIDEQSPTQLEAGELTEEVKEIDETIDESFEFIKMFRRFESRKGRILFRILVHAYLIKIYYGLIMMVNQKIDHWISHLVWIVLISILLSSYKYMDWKTPSLGSFRGFLCCTIFCTALFLLSLSVHKLLLRGTNEPVVPFFAPLYSLLYVPLVSLLPSRLVPLLVPNNVTPGVYVFFMISCWTIMWIFTEVWCAMSLSVYSYYLSLVYAAILFSSSIYAYYFVDGDDELEGLDLVPLEILYRWQTQSDPEMELEALLENRQQEGIEEDVSSKDVDSENEKNKLKRKEYLYIAVRRRT